MKVLFATKNPAKFSRYYDKLKANGIELISLKDLEINFNINETGNSALENATIKAKAYYDISKIITIGMDDNLFFENVPEEKQPGTHVRRVNGKELSDDEMIEYYSNLAKEHGGKIEAKWVYGMVIYNGKESKSYTWSKNSFYLTSIPSQNRNPGYPLNSITIVPKFNKYLVDLTPEEKEVYGGIFSENDVVEFISNSVKSLQ